jgi:hypothetical protein
MAFVYNNLEVIIAVPVVEILIIHSPSRIPDSSFGFLRNVSFALFKS